jgi:hypothetical protein
MGGAVVVMGMGGGAAAEPVELDAATAWRQVVKAYASGVWAERVEVAVRTGGRVAGGGGAGGGGGEAVTGATVRRSELVVRYAAGWVEPGEGGEAGRERGAVLAVELGTAGSGLGGGGGGGGGPVFRLVVREGRLTAIGTAADRVWRVTVDDPPTLEGLERVLPALPLVQVAAAQADAESPVVRLTAYASDVVWLKASVDVAGGRLSLEGRSSAGPVRVMADAKSGRLKRVTAALPAEREGEAAGEMDLVINAVAAGDPAGWRLPEEGRREVGSAAELGRGDRLAVGEAVPSGWVLPGRETREGTRRDVRGWVREAGEVVLLVLVRPGAGDATGEGVGRAVAEAAAGLKALTAEGVGGGLGLRVVGLAGGGLSVGSRLLEVEGLESGAVGWMDAGWAGLEATGKAGTALGLVVVDGAIAGRVVVEAGTGWREAVKRAVEGAKR